MQSTKWSFNQQDWEKWSLNFVRFVALPTVISFLLAYQGALDWRVAWGVAAGTFYTSVIDFLRKLYAGDVNSPVIPPAV